MASENLNNIPQQVANVPAPEPIPGSGQTRLVIESIQGSINELKSDVREIKSHRHPDFVFLITVFATGFLLLAGMLIFGYFRLDDKVQTISNTSIRVETKLDGFLQRIPPVGTPVPTR